MAAFSVPVILLAASAVTRASPRPLGVPGNWHLVFESEFNGPHLPSQWQRGWFGAGVTKPANRLEGDCYSPKNLSFPGDGTLQLAVTTRPSRCGGRNEPATGALISTNPDDGRGRGFQYRYGVLQAQVYISGEDAKLSDWPAVWAVAQPGRGYGEDDVMEGLAGAACWHFHTTVGWQGGCEPTLAPGWHTFTSDWEPGRVVYYYDGKEVGQITSGITTGAMYLVIDDTSTPYAATAGSLRVRSVRVWQQTSSR